MVPAEGRPTQARTGRADRRAHHGSSERCDTVTVMRAIDEHIVSVLNDTRFYDPCRTASAERQNRVRD